LDLLRGTVMVLMQNEVTQLPRLAESFPHSWFWSVVAYNTDHVPWQGCSVHDLIQSAFSFLVGAAASIHTAFEMN
jgi:heparan-alpha-glucosaminide N-acetyltransferase